MKRTERDVGASGNGNGDGGFFGYGGDSFGNVQWLGYEGLLREYREGPQSNYEDAVE